jgi:hypothetical protein
MHCANLISRSGFSELCPADQSTSESPALSAFGQQPAHTQALIFVLTMHRSGVRAVLVPFFLIAE